ncbi:copper chaperone CopZ [Neomicrococcus aestuarii]|uniref:Copper chaperone CopZ n=1 Tax=Neomicrococcus aestuarii TaxID=556325 RepID=A0A7W8TSK1_9MICC|nr:heavy-metal-associated domain-containing protein [Neomicrococcus aestuarii]MBB5512157.1 copper chaperone CopZ [Neomicrococcus aestuarii]
MAEKVTLKVLGMDCTGCEQRLGTALRRLEGVSEATADHVTGDLTLRYDPAITTRAALIERVQTAGYEVGGGSGK